MRYSSSHKAETRQRIIREASYRYRKDGINGTGLVPLMKALGLTQGGFYAHFDSKDALVEASLEAAAHETLEKWQDLADGDAFFAAYLSPRHRDNPGEGCPLPSLAAELGLRGTRSPIVDVLVTHLAQRLDTCPIRREGAGQGIVVLAAMVGALSLARSVSDPQLSERILKAVQAALQSCD